MLGSDMVFLLRVASEPEYFIRYLKVFMKSAGINCANFLFHTWKILIWKIFSYQTASSWIPALHCLIEYGVDIHQQCDHDESAYIQILRAVGHPFAADNRAYTWLSMLKACGVDLVSYVEVETALIQDVGVDFKWGKRRRRRSIVLLEYDGLQIPSWRWALPSESSAAEALGEFVNVGSEFEEYLVRFVYPTGPDDLGAWKREEDYTSWTESCFPFCF